MLHPDEVHDGRAGTKAGFGYRIVYVEPSHIAEPLRVIRGRPHPLPFVREPVSTNARLSRAVEEPFGPLDPLAVDSLIVELAEGLLDGAQGGGDRQCRASTSGPSSALASSSTRSEPGSSIQRSWSRSRG